MFATTPNARYLDARPIRSSIPRRRQDGCDRRRSRAGLEPTHVQGLRTPSRRAVAQHRRPAGGNVFAILEGQPHNKVAQQHRRRRPHPRQPVSEVTASWPTISRRWTRCSSCIIPTWTGSGMCGRASRRRSVCPGLPTGAGPGRLTHRSRSSSTSTRKVNRPRARTRATASSIERASITPIEPGSGEELVGWKADRVVIAATHVRLQRASGGLGAVSAA